MTKTNQNNETESIDRRIVALESFKDWSNYLLITTAAALGWVAEQGSSSPMVMSLAVWCLGISIVAGIFTLALVPLIAEQMDKETSIYLVPARFYLGGEVPRTMYLPQACRPQHVSFIFGVIFYCASKTGLAPSAAVKMPWFLPVVLVAAFVLIGVRSHRRETTKSKPPDVA